MAVLLVAFGVAAGFFAHRVPTSFLPDEDQGYSYVSVQLPNAASLERTTRPWPSVEKIILEYARRSILDVLRRLQSIELRSYHL